MTQIMQLAFVIFGLMTFTMSSNVMGETAIQDVEGVPPWITEKGLSLSKDKEFLFGVGLASGVKHATLKRRVAEVQARQDLAATLEANLEDTMAMTIEESTEGDQAESNTSTILSTKQVVKTTLRRAEIVEYWEHPEKNDAYALARIPRKHFEDTIKKIMLGENK